MKKLFGILVSLCASVICLTGVSAKEIDLTSSEYDNSYIVGNRVFTLNSYALSAWNVKEATDEYNRFSKASEETPLLYVINGYIYEVNKDGINWNEKVAISEISENGLVDVFGVNDDPIVYPAIPYEEEKVNAKIESVLTNLNASASRYGIEGISYQEENHILTFNVSNGNEKISSFAQSGVVDFIKAFIADEFGVQSVAINGADYGDITNLTEADIISCAAEAIRSIIGTDAEDVLSSLEGKEITVSVTYGDGTKVDYTISFIEV